MHIHSAFASVIGIVLNKTLNFNNLVVVHSMNEFFYSIAWMGSASTIAGTIAGQITGIFADRCVLIFRQLRLEKIVNEKQLSRPCGIDRKYCGKMGMAPTFSPKARRPWWEELHTSLMMWVQSRNTHQARVTR